MHLVREGKKSSSIDSLCLALSLSLNFNYKKAHNHVGSFKHAKSLPT